MSHDVNLGYILGKVNNVNSAELKGDEIIQFNTSSSTINITSTPLDDHIANNVENPHELTKEQLGLSKVENKSPNEILNSISNKVISNAVGFDVNETIFSNRVFGFELDSNEAEPSRAIRYIGKNKFYKPAHMNFGNDGVFDYGDWGDAWFIKNIKVVLMRYEGTIECELDKNDYTKDTKGNTVDITSANRTGNVMVGIPTVWIKYDTTDPMKSRFYFSPVKVDDTWHAYSHTNRKGEIVPYKYLAAYEGWSDGTRMRSVSGVTMPLNGNYTKMYPQQQRYQCMNNYTGDDITDDENNWDMEAWCDRMLINLLLLLIGRNTDTQEVFGHGNEYGSGQNRNSAQGAPWNSNNWGILNTGTMNDKGLFWGANDTGSNHLDYKGVKVFGIEHWWGNILKYALGWYHVDSTNDNASDTFIKMTPEKVNGVDYIPSPQNNNNLPPNNNHYPTFTWDIYSRSMWESFESYGYTKYSWFEEASSGKGYLQGSGIQWKGNQYGISPYKYPADGNDKYFPDYTCINVSEYADPHLCVAICGGIYNEKSFNGAFYCSVNRINYYAAGYGSFLCSF